MGLWRNLVPRPFLPLVLFCAGSFPCLAQTRPLAIEAVLTETKFNHERAPLGTSRDGQFFAYTQTGVDGLSQLRVINLRTRALINIAEGLHSASDPVWSPDGKFLAFFVSDSEKAGVEHHYAIWIWDRSSASGRELTPSIAQPLSPGRLIWTADSHFLITDVESAKASVRDQPKPSPAQNSSAGASVRVDSVNLPNDLLHEIRSGASPEKLPNALTADIGRIDVSSGSLERLATNVSPYAYAIGPSGSQIAVLTRDIDTVDDLDLWIADNAASQLRKVVSHVALGRAAMSWSPDGRLVAIHSTNQRYGEEPRTGSGVCVLVAITTGKQTQFSADSQSVDNLNIPLWTSQSDSVVLVEAGKLVTHPVVAPEKSDSIAIPGATIGALLRDQLSPRLSDATTKDRLVAIMTDANGLFMRIATINYRTKAVTVLGDAFSYYAGDAAAIVRGRPEIVVGVEGPAKPFDFLLLDVDTGKQERLTNLNPQYGSYEFGSARVIDYTNATGEPREAILLIPSAYRPGTRYPTIVFERDRSNSWFARQFGLWGGPYNMQLYATRGYAVLYPDIAVTRTPRERVMSDVLPAIDAAVGTGVVDPERLALYGHSLGGYHAMMLLVQTKRFAAAIVSQGIYNLFTDYAVDPGYASSFATGTLGPPWQYPERYVANSPYLFLNELTTPILLVGSSRDAYVDQGDALFAALQRGNKTVEYIRYNDEAHNAASWTLANRRDYVERTLTWVDYWLKTAGDGKAGWRTGVRQDVLRY